MRWPGLEVEGFGLVEVRAESIPATREYA